MRGVAAMRGMRRLRQMLRSKRPGLARRRHMPRRMLRTMRVRVRMLHGRRRMGRPVSMAAGLRRRTLVSTVAAHQGDGRYLVRRSMRPVGGWRMGRCRQMVCRKRGAGLVVRAVPAGMMHVLRSCSRMLGCDPSMRWRMVTRRTMGCSTHVLRGQMLSRRHARLSGLRVMTGGRLRWLRDRRRVRSRLHAGGWCRMSETRALMRCRNRVMRLHTQRLGHMRIKHWSGGSVASICSMSRERQMMYRKNRSLRRLMAVAIGRPPGMDR